MGIAVPSGGGPRRPRNPSRRPHPVPRLPRTGTRAAGCRRRRMVCQRRPGPARPRPAVGHRAARDARIISGGENIQPEEVEQVLLEHPAVRAAVCVAVPDAEFGSRPAAFLALAYGPLPPPDLEFHLGARLARFKHRYATSRYQPSRPAKAVRPAPRSRSRAPRSQPLPHVRSPAQDEAPDSALSPAPSLHHGTPADGRKGCSADELQYHR